jgi:hypothetical protein
MGHPSQPDPENWSRTAPHLPTDGKYGPPTTNGTIEKETTQVSAEQPKELFATGGTASQAARIVSRRVPWRRGTWGTQQDDTHEVSRGGRATFRGEQEQLWLVLGVRYNRNSAD